MTDIATSTIGWIQPKSKLIIRKLPPNLTQEEWFKSVNKKIPNFASIHDFAYYVKGRVSNSDLKKFPSFLLHNLPSPLTQIQESNIVVLMSIFQIHKMPSTSLKKWRDKCIWMGEERNLELRLNMRQINVYLRQSLLILEKGQLNLVDLRDCSWFFFFNLFVDPDFMRFLNMLEKPEEVAPSAEVQYAELLKKKEEDEKIQKPVSTPLLDAIRAKYALRAKQVRF